jgi:hypothetical protein
VGVGGGGVGVGEGGVGGGGREKGDWAGGEGELCSFAPFVGRRSWQWDAAGWLPSREGVGAWSRGGIPLSNSPP